MNIIEITTEAGLIAQAIESRKVRALIYDVEKKENLALSKGLPVDTYYFMNYHDWCDLRGTDRVVIIESEWATWQETTHFTRRLACLQDAVGNVMRPYKDNEKRLKFLRKKYGPLFDVYMPAVVETREASTCIADHESRADELVAANMAWKTIADWRKTPSIKE